MAAQRYRTAGYGAMVESETGQWVTDMDARALEALLLECYNVLDNYADVANDEGGEDGIRQIPNRAMALMQQIREVL